MGGDLKYPIDRALKNESNTILRSPPTMREDDEKMVPKRRVSMFRR
jgi:hypothetical protein